MFLRHDLGRGCSLVPLTSRELFDRLKNYRHAECDDIHVAFLLSLCFASAAAERQRVDSSGERRLFKAEIIANETVIYIYMYIYMHC